ncbi:S-layer homology domain-containing protein [Oscillospiraceae bacterium WX1]
MKKALARIIATMLILGVIGFPASAAAVGVTSVSEAGISFIKEYEGFSSRAYIDAGKYFIGYGTQCNPGDYPNGISEATADSLLRKALDVKEDAVNKVLAKYNVTLKQNEYDALLSLSYNIGTVWMSSSNRIYSYMLSGFDKYTELEIVNALGTWCHQGKAVLNKLVDRRIREAKMLLFNDYTGSDPHQYKYITYDAAGGSVPYSIYFYTYNMPYGALQSATLSGKTLEGWYTSDGTKISPTDLAVKNLNVTARWTDGPGPVTPGGFSDVKQTDWFYPYVSGLTEQKVVSGYPDGTFQPNRTVSSGEALKLILRAAGFDEQPGDASSWASGYLQLALSKGIVDSGEISDLNAPITRLEVAKITARALGLPALDPEPIFLDTTDGHVLTLYYCGIITGVNVSGGLKYYPDSSIMRSEMSAVIWRVTSSDLFGQ